MLKSTLLFLFGCSFCFAQIQVSTTSTMNLEGDGTKVKSTDGQGSGSGPSTPPHNNPQVRNDLNVYLSQGSLNVSLNEPNNKFNRYMVYDVSGNLKKDQVISVTNSYTVDISNLNSGHYYISVVLPSSNVVLTKSFIKP